jgi:RNA polymerase sigma-70 factor (ECF subfamily)
LRWNLSQIPIGKRCYVVDAPSEAFEGAKAGEAPLDIEGIFRTQYERIARVIARVVRDPARAEELAVEVFLKLWRHQQAHDGNVEGWLYRVAIRMALDELRRQTRRTRYEHLLGLVRRAPTPEEVCAAKEEKERVRLILSSIDPRQAELILLRGNGLSYDEVASALDLNPASIGTALSRAQQSFRKEYTKRYGEK